MRPTTRTTRIALASLIAILLGLGVILFQHSGDTLLDNVLSKIRGRFTVDERVASYKDIVAQRLGSKFIAAGLPYPPSSTTFVAFKDTHQLEIYGRKSADAPWVFVASYPILRGSGTQGPKLVEGDKQIPEGIYRAESLNPNSKFHLAIRVNYPNEFDLQMARLDGRSNLGGDIMIHGSIFSVGCLAMGDDAAEDLFVLAALTKPDNVFVIISPVDFRKPDTHFSLAEPSWTHVLYESLRAELRHYRR